MGKFDIRKDLKFDTYEDIIMGGRPSQEEEEIIREGNVTEVKLSDLYSFSKHTYRVVEDDALKELSASIQDNGVMVPAIVRSRAEGGYEIIAGHRRKRACEMAGLDSMPVVVKELSDDDAMIIMVDSNLQRETLLPSEKAWSYRYKLDALKHKGTKNTASLKTIEDESSDNARTIRRYIRLTYLIDGLLEMVDQGVIQVIAAADVSYLEKEEQSWVLKTLGEDGATLTGTQAKMLKNRSQDHALTEIWVRKIMTPAEKVKPRQISWSSARLSKYFPPEYSSEEIDKIMTALVLEWRRKNVAEEE